MTQEEFVKAITPTPDRPIPIDTQQAILILKARAEQAEARLKEAVADIEELLAQEEYLGVCWACANNNDCKSGNECVPKWRGMR